MNEFEMENGCVYILPMDIYKERLYQNWKSFAVDLVFLAVLPIYLRVFLISSSYSGIAPRLPTV